MLIFQFCRGPSFQRHRAFLRCVPNSLSVNSVSHSKYRFLDFARPKLEDKSFHTLQLTGSKPALCLQYDDWAIVLLT